MSQFPEQDANWSTKCCGFSRYRVVWGGTRVISLRWGDNRGVMWGMPHLQVMDTDTAAGKRTNLDTRQKTQITQDLNIFHLIVTIFSCGRLLLLSIWFCCFSWLYFVDACECLDEEDLFLSSSLLLLQLPCFPEVRKETRGAGGGEKLLEEMGRAV